MGVKAPTRPPRAVAPHARARATTNAAEPVLSLTAAELQQLIEAAAERGAARAVAALLNVAGDELQDAPATPQGVSELVDARTLAGLLGVTAQTVRQHADELGGVRVGKGPKAPWRFDPEHAKTRLACCASRESQPVNPSAEADPGPSRRRSRCRLPNGLPPADPILTAEPLIPGGLL